MATSDNLKSKVVSGLFWRYLERTLAQGIQMLVTIVLARILMPEDYGDIALVSVLINIALVFVQSGFGNALIQKEEAASEDFSTALYFSVFLGFVLFLLFFFCAPFIGQFYHSETLTPVIRVLAISLIIAGINSVQQAYVSRTMQFRKFFFSTLAGTIISAFTGIGAALAGLGVWALVIQQLTNQCIDTLVLSFTSGWKPTREFSGESLKKIYSYGWKLLCASLIDTIYSNLYTLVIGKHFSSGDVGYYDKGKQFPSLIIVNINATIQSVLFPALSSQQSDQKRVKQMMRRTIKTSTFVIFPCMAGLAVIAEPLIRLLLTEKWLPAVMFLRFYCLIYALWPVHTANLQAINAVGKSEIFLKLEVIKKIMGVLVLIITLPMGLRAMMIGNCVNSVLGMFLNAAPNRRLLGYTVRELFEDILPGAVLSAVMAAAIWLLGMQLPGDLLKMICQIAAGVAIYAGFARIFHVESMDYIRHTIRELRNGRYAAERQN